MIILPILIRDSIMNAEVKLKSATKIESDIVSPEIKESDIVVNTRHFKGSAYDERQVKYHQITDFIRNNSFYYKAPFLVSTRKYDNKNTYDIYRVFYPLEKVSTGLDELYGRIITDMRKEIPNKKIGREISLEKLGIDEYLTDENIKKVKEIVEKESEEKWDALFEQKGLTKVKETLDFMNLFDCTVISMVPVKTVEEMVDNLEVTNDNTYRELKSYYDTAVSNKKVYHKLFKLNKMLYNRPIEILHSGPIKKKEITNEGRKAA